MLYSFKKQQIRYKSTSVRYGSLNTEQKKKVQFSDFVHQYSDNRLIKLGEPMGPFIKNPEEGAPLGGIWAEFAFTDFTKGKTIERFFEKYGPLDGDYPTDGPHYYPVRKFLIEGTLFRRLVELYNARDKPARIVEVLRERDRQFGYQKFPEITQENAVSKLAGPGGVFDELLNPNLEGLDHPIYLDRKTSEFQEWGEIKSLLQAIYLRFSRIMLLPREKGELKRCKNWDVCHFYFQPTSGKQLFHSGQCRQSYFDIRRDPEQKLKQLESQVADMKAEHDENSAHYREAVKKLEAFQEELQEKGSRHD